MRKFIIVPISHCLKNNKIAKSGDIVDETQLTSPASALLEAGFIKEVQKEKKEAVSLLESDSKTNDLKVVVTEEKPEGKKEVAKTPVISKEEISKMKKNVIKK